MRVRKKEPKSGAVVEERDQDPDREEVERWVRHYENFVRSLRKRTLEDTETWRSSRKQNKPSS